MLYCPNCGIVVKEQENFCLNCGEQVPKNIEQRFEHIKRFNRLWFLPLTIFLLFLIAIIPFYFFLDQKNAKARELFERGEQEILNEEYETAKSYFEEALTYRDDFLEAQTALRFSNHAIEISEQLAEVSTYLDQAAFQEALNIVNEAENTIRNYHGQAISDFIQYMLILRNDINTARINEELMNRPSIETLKNLLWEAEAIQTEKAEEISQYIRDEIVDYTFSKASEKLNSKQFTDSRVLIEDGLKFVPQSEKLHSFRSTIDKEQTAFEIDEQQRIEQAINIAEEEREHNEQSAVKLDKINVSTDDQNRIVVKGKVVSNATIPVHSIAIKYSLKYEEEDFIENKVFVYPETLYPDETGKFEFTHYEESYELSDIKIDVKKIQWYTD